MQFSVARTGFALVLLALAAAAQDTRTVVEPTIPPSCTVLKAEIGRAGLSITAEEETRPDTARIQVS